MVGRWPWFEAPNVQPLVNVAGRRQSNAAPLHPERTLPPNRHTKVGQAPFPRGTARSCFGDAAPLFANLALGTGLDAPATHTVSLSESSSAKSVAKRVGFRPKATLHFRLKSKATLQSVPGRTPPCAPPTANRDEPSGGIISVATPDSAPPLVPLQSEHERLLQNRPAITTAATAGF